MSNIANPKYVSFSSPSTGWIHGSYTTGPPLYNFYIVVYKTTNFGLNWNSVYSFQTTSINPGPLFFVSDNIGYKVIQIGSVYIAKTNSGGSSWSNIFNSSSDVNSIYFINANKGWFARDNGKILFTSNGGSSFSEQQSGVTSKLYAVFFINDSIGWISTTNGIILKTYSGGVTSANISNNFVPEKFSLSQNYPNPFNPTAKIKFDIPSNGKGQTSNVRLIVYDVLGREVATLVNEKLTEGSYEVEFNGSNLSSGIYFYKLETERFTQTKKMIILK
jgi:photosystem II stability/assembly factor-like uncharacterized protein